jgi:hypothetical protein
MRLDALTHLEKYGVLTLLILQFRGLFFSL